MYGLNFLKKQSHRPILFRCEDMAKNSQYLISEYNFFIYDHVCEGIFLAEPVFCLDIKLSEIVSQRRKNYFIIEYY